MALGRSLDGMAGIAAPSADPALAALLARVQQLPPQRQQLVKDLINALAG